jgi:hypothetical protein
MKRDNSSLDPIRSDEHRTHSLPHKHHFQVSTAELAHFILRVLDEKAWGFYEDSWILIFHLYYVFMWHKVVLCSERKSEECRKPQNLRWLLVGLTFLRFDYVDYTEINLMLRKIIYCILIFFFVSILLKSIEYNLY